MRVEPRPARYREIVDDLRAKILDRTYPVGAPLPSTARLMDLYDVSSTVIQRALRELKHEGTVIGQPGKAVYVQEEPQPAEPSPEYREIMEQIRDLRETVSELSSSLDARLTALEQAAHQRRPPNQAR